jgi:excisionase family DNA binding protein
MRLTSLHCLGSHAVARLAGVSDRAVRKAASKGYLTGCRTGRSWYFTEADVAAWQERRHRSAHSCRYISASPSDISKRHGLQRCRCRHFDRDHFIASRDVLDWLLIHLANALRTRPKEDPVIQAVTEWLQAVIACVNTPYSERGLQ